ncbi:MAG: hypothetical protein AB3N17_02170 [Tateyamaria sp.]
MKSVVITCVMVVFGTSATPDVAQSVFDRFDPQIKDRLEVTIDACTIKRVITRPNTCNGLAVSQTVEKRVVLTEIGTIEVKDFRAPEPFMVTFKLATDRPSRFSLIRDRVLLGEEEAFRRYNQHMDFIQGKSTQKSGDYFSQCDGSKNHNRSPSETLFLTDRPEEWDGFVELAKSCGVNEIKDTYTDP